MTKESFPEIVAPLLEWFALNARALPWRETVDPYAIWVSEIMLQQTRVDTVIPYYRRFLRELPDVAALAECGETRLLKLWEGLGYYSRVRNMQRAARIVLEKFGGVFPHEVLSVKSLPGIGDYTAGAICSIAFGASTPAVDGNVLRVITRITGDLQNIDKPEFKKGIEKRLAVVYPTEYARDFTESLMELGACICLPNGAPLCEKCPLKEVCTARAESLTDRIPVRGQKPVRRSEALTVFVLHCGGKIAFQKRAAKGLLAGLWQYPNVTGVLDEGEVTAFFERLGANVTVLRRITAKHIFTHIEWHMTAYALTVDKEIDAYTWLDSAHEVPLPTAFRRLNDLMTSPINN